MAKIVGLLTVFASVLLSACAGTSPNLHGSSDGNGRNQTAYDSPFSAFAIGSDPRLDQAPEVWSRIAAEFRLDNINNSRIDAELKRYIDYPNALEKTSARSEPFIHFVAQQVSNRRMPGEIALVPMIESGFHTNARSHRRATGLWQIMPHTGARFGLSTSWWYDGRKDVLAATQAALNYLEHLNGLFEGDWLLTLAAYNAGEGRVLRAQASNRKHGKPTDYWHLSLPKETRRYIPRLLAVARIVENPQAYGVALAPIPNRPHIEVVDLGDQLDLTYAAELAAISPELLYQYNPGFKRWATDPSGPHRLLLPAANAQKLRLALTDLGPEQRIVWHRHQIQAGETLSHVARQYPVSVDTLMNANRLRSSRIRKGDYLLVPTPRNPNATLAVIAAPSRDAANAGGSRVEYTVRSGDSLWVIARRFGVSHRKLASWNDLALDDVLRPGRKLVVWT